jgi:hypothetical protein
MKLTGPEATPLVLCTKSFFGLRRENAKPVPPPDLWMRAWCFSVLKMPSIESSIGRTKQAASCCSSFPAFMRVGLFGRNSRLDMRR